LPASFRASLQAPTVRLGEIIAKGRGRISTLHLNDEALFSRDEQRIAYLAGP
jgi:hypothetical protein